MVVSTEYVLLDQGDHTVVARMSEKEALQFVRAFPTEVEAGFYLDWMKTQDIPYTQRQILRRVTIEARVGDPYDE